ncbi:MAG: formate hydrogenlyase [Betaproteobacteria bacterium]
MSQIINLLAALLLLLSFGMLSQRRVLALVGLFAAQGALLTVSTLLTAQTTGQAHLYFSAGLTLVLKVVVLPLVLRRLVRRLDLAGRAEMLINPTTTLLAGIGLVIVAFQVALPLSEFAGTITRGTLGIATACVLLALLMMITRRNAVAQVIGFLSLENGLFFAATSVTYGMPMIVELGIALDVLVGTFVFGVFFFRIRETFDTLDTGRLEKAGDS